MSFAKTTLKALSLTALSGSFVLSALPAMQALTGLESSAHAQDKPQKTRKVPAMSLPVHKQVQEAQEAMDLDDLTTASAKLEELLGKKNINDYERAVVWQLKASIAYERSDTPAAIRAFETILTLKESIPEALEYSILFNLSQLYFTQEAYDEALDYVKKWEAVTTTVSVSQLAYISQLYYARSDYKNALTYIYRTIAEAEAVDTVEVKENWYNIALASHWELNQYDKVRDVLEILVINWPKASYWRQLAGVYGELGQEQVSYSISEAAYKQGFFDDQPSALVNMAQILIARDAPIKAAWVLEKAFKEERIENNANNIRLLGTSYLRASEYRKSIEPLRKSAEMDNDPTLWLQVAQLELSLERYKDSAGSFAKAIKEFEKNSKANASKLFSSYMQQGSALIEAKDFEGAKKALEKARNFADSRNDKRQVDGWESYLKGEKAREDILASN